MKNSCLIIGVGNILRRDDGIGPAVIERLRAEPISSVDLRDGATDGLTVIEYLKPYQRAVIIDAVDMQAEPGTIRMFTPEEAIINIKAEALSTHGFGLAEVLKLMQSLEIKTELKIIGVQPESIEFGEGLTEKVKVRVEEIAELVKEEIKLATKAPRHQEK